MRNRMIALAVLLLSLTSLTSCSWMFRLPQTPNLTPSTTLERAPVPSQMHKLVKGGM